MRELTDGLGLEIKSTDAVIRDDESKRWETGVFSFSSAKGLSSIVFFYNGKMFGLRSGEISLILIPKTGKFSRKPLDGLKLVLVVTTAFKSDVEKVF